ncbi:PLDc N-terminal domain-containing protein [Microbispora sp. H10670]|uniref:PLDc N-terminal domain-containing protein n=1 Tax=Microbispora sp. H10670 TaxID=2729108 RepID=UPI00160115F5|nr:PLDc N-terminal domain-containing protein [Microbispora sp. H10670]
MKERFARKPAGERRRSRRPGRSRQWADLTPRRRAVLLTLASVELSLTATAAVDLFRRPRTRLRGRKALWWLALAVQPFGPIAYLALARRPRRT